MRTKIVILDVDRDDGTDSEEEAERIINNYHRKINGSISNIMEGVFKKDKKIR